jgi:dipeptidase D
MSDAVRNLEPKTMWNHFADLNQVPRASKKEEQVIDFIKSFGEGLGLKTVVDDVGNVIIHKPASPGMEDRTPIVMQSHLDMVHQKNNETDFDFATQGIEMLVDDDWVRANGTTLGADNGIGVASIMTILSSNDIDHPAVDALFTIDEETGMTGAQGLKGGLLNGKILLNLDTEDDDELTIGCAGGVDVTAKGDFFVEPSENLVGFQITVRGLKGGHSGMDIYLGRGNANKIMNRILWHGAEKCGLRVGQIDGGGLRNAIPRESVATVAIPPTKVDDFKKSFSELADTICSEYQTTDPECQIVLESAEVFKLIPADVQQKLLGTIYGITSGIHRMSPDIPDLVQTSNNLARVSVKDGKFEILCLTRSSVNSERDDLANALCANLALSGAKVDAAGAYPGWTPAPHSSIVELMAGIYEEMFDEPAHVAACHAGLECGILGQNYPDVEMISFGPNIRGAHSPDEKVQISSVQKYWGFLLETLKRIPTSA